MNVLSLFDGMSCGQIALNRCGIKYDNYFASEIKKHAIQVTQHNYPNTIQLGDIRNIKGSDLPEIDLLIGGSPCQDFSLANKVKKGLQGEKSGLFFEYTRIMKETKPKYFLLENVVMDEKSMNFISQEIGVYPVRINSSLVSAQLRDRLYWTNIKGTGENLFGNYIKLPEDKKIMLKDIITSGDVSKEKCNCLLESESRNPGATWSSFRRFFKWGFVNLVFENKMFYESFMLKDKTLEQFKEIWKEGDTRKLNQIELERLQTVPEGYTKILNRNKAACLLGDGWTIDVICHIFNEGIKSGQFFTGDK